MDKGSGKESTHVKMQNFPWDPKRAKLMLIKAYENNPHPDKPAMIFMPNVLHIFPNELKILIYRSKDNTFSVTHIIKFFLFQGKGRKNLKK